MSVFIKNIWRKLKDIFKSAQTPTKPHIRSSFLHSSESTKTSNPKEDVSVEVYPPTASVEKASTSLEPHCPVFTIAVGLVDIIMLFIVYIAQGETIITSETLMKMGCKYVPCMKPLSLKAEQDLYNVELRSRCQSFLYPYQFFRFFTPIFLHSGITHLLSNLIYQALAGALLEGRYGIKTLGVCFILFGFSGNVMSALWNPKNISVGASGAVYGLLLFCMIDNILRIFTINNSHDKIIQSLITLLVIPYFILSFFFDVDNSGRTDHAAHIGGAIMGILIAMFLCDMPRFITSRVLNGETGIKFIAVLWIVSYFLVTLILFYFFTPVKLK